MERVLVFLAALMFLASCGGKSDVTAEVVPLDKVCAYEKWKTVAVEGHLAPNIMACERASQKKRSGVVWCAFKIYHDQNLTGANIWI